MRQRMVPQAAGRRNWVVSVSSETSDPLVYGPYHQHVAQRRAEALNVWLDANSETIGWAHATAYPIRTVSLTEMIEEWRPPKAGEEGP